MRVCVLSAWCVALFLSFGDPARSASVDGLYRAQVITTGQSEEHRPAAFAQCLQDVLVKVSGDPRLIDDPRAIALSAEAGSLVRRYQYRDRLEGKPLHDEQGTRDRPHDLTVEFDPEAVDAALRSLGREPWGSSRPTVAVLLAVRFGSASYLLTEDSPSGIDQREAFRAASTRIALPIALPTGRVLDEAGLRPDGLMAAETGRLQAAARAAGGDVALAGHMAFSDAVHGWIVEWRLDDAGRSYTWRVSGVNFDEAFRNALRGAAQILSGHGSPAAGAPGLP